jgi:hypothetical protein
MPKNCKFEQYKRSQHHFNTVLKGMELSRLLVQSDIQDICSTICDTNNWILLFAAFAMKKKK